MAINNPYIPGDPYSYDLKWIVATVKAILQQLGTLDEAIDQKIFEGFLEHSIVQFKNVPDMLAADIKDGSIVLTLGYYEEGDQGGAFYLVKDFNPGQCALDYFLTMDNNAQIAIPVIVTPYVLPEMFGAKGDGTTDDTEALQHAANYAAAMKADLTTASRTYYITDTVTIDGTDVINILLDGVIKLGMNDRPGVHIKNSTRNTIKISVSGTEYNGGYSTIPTDFNIPVLPFVGVLFDNTAKSTIYLSAENCHVGARFLGDGKGCVFNTVNLGMMVNNAINLELMATNSGWTTENIFLNGNFSCWSDNTFKQYHVDIKQRTDNNWATGNVFIKPSFEGGGLPIYLDNAAYNTFEQIRVEAGTTFYGIVTSGRDNVFDGGYNFEPPLLTDTVNNQKQFVTNIRMRKIASLVHLGGWDFEAEKNIYTKSTGAYYASIMPGVDNYEPAFTGNLTDANYTIPAASITAAETDGFHNRPQQIYGVYVDVSDIKTIFARFTNASGGTTGRFSIRFYDSNFTAIAAVKGVDFDMDQNHDGYWQQNSFVTAGNYAGIYMPLYLNNTNIKYIFIGVQGYTSLNSIHVYTPMVRATSNPSGRVFARQAKIGQVALNAIKGPAYKGMVVLNAPQAANSDGSYNFAYVCTDAANQTWAPLKSGV